MLYSLDQVALYLNRATILIKKAKGDLEYITGKKGTTIAASGLGAEETQCLSFGSAIWIANNDNGDTLIQMALLNKLGINTAEQLIDHVDRYQARVMATAKGAFVPAAMTAEESLLFAIASRHDADSAPGEKFAPAAPMELPPSVKNPEYKLTASGPAPSSGLVFVTGSFMAVGGGEGSEHAEQKLLVALSKSFGSVNGTVTISGCKMACSVCEKVLEDTAKELKSRNIALKYVNTYVNELRDKAKLSKKNAVNVKALDVALYFPVG
jgi:hypothetical protein